MSANKKKYSKVILLQIGNAFNQPIKDKKKLSTYGFGKIEMDSN